jgi:hypothetical protein
VRRTLGANDIATFAACPRFFAAVLGHASTAGL